MAIAIATIPTHPHRGSTILKNTPIPSARQNSPIVFLKPLVNIFLPPLTNRKNYCKMSNIYYENYIKW